jgi:thiol:disulfide interchange protein
MRPIILLFAALLSLNRPALAQFDASPGTPASTPTLVSENKTVAPGETFSVALELAHPDEWHSYYKNSGGVEESPVIKWTLPVGFTAGSIQWPVPEVKDGYFGKSFVYQGSPVFLVEITAPASQAAGGTATLTADATWQICKDSCLNEKGSFTLTLPVAAVSGKDPETAALFKKARAEQATRIPTLKIEVISEGSDFTLRVEPADTTKGLPTDFIPDVPFLQPASADGKIERDGNAWKVTLKRKKLDAFDQPIPQGKALSGILVAPVSVEIPDTVIGNPPAKALAISKYLPLLGAMMLGGLILNLMPCVFPVIGLKIMGFVQQAGSDRKKIVLHGLMFTGGVLASFAVISGILYAARSSAVEKGWGYQLQDPWVVLALMILMFVLALNMFGVFELGTSATSVGGSLQSRQGLSGSFFSGVLATVVATPCSAPFLGAAIGVAIGLPAFQFFAAFAAMAIGLSTPYLLLSIFPKLIDFLPRPGAWMESFKQGMSFLLFATAGYLLWVYSGQIGQENLLGPIFGLSGIAVAAWIYGRWNLPHKIGRTRGIAVVLTLLFAVGGFMLAKPPVKSSLVWEHWSQERVDELLGAGTPVYVDFTAQWCATCQFNKKTAYTDKVIALMKRKGVVALKGDKTNPDAKIDEKIRELGRAAIPVNVLYAAAAAADPDPVITPELLTASYLEELFKRLPDSKDATSSSLDGL